MTTTNDRTPGFVTLTRWYAPSRTGAPRSCGWGAVEIRTTRSSKARLALVHPRRPVAGTDSLARPPLSVPRRAPYSIQTADGQEFDTTPAR